jgi:hypothetical protein
MDERRLMDYRVWLEEKELGLLYRVFEYALSNINAFQGEDGDLRRLYNKFDVR